MKQLFQIGEEGSGSGTLWLLLEIGPDHFHASEWDGGAGAIRRLSYYSVEENALPQSMDTLLQDLRGRSYEKVVVCSSFSTAILVPHQFARQGETLLGTVFDDPSQMILSDPISEWQITNQFSIPRHLHRQITDAFPDSTFIHSFTPAIRRRGEGEGNVHLQLHFTGKHFQVVLKKGTDVHLAQIYAYRTPLDVVYYLLKICAELEIDQSQVQVYISGLIDESSALYRELHHYFINLQFAHTGAVKMPGHELPSHFFVSTSNLAACVS